MSKVAPQNKRGLDTNLLSMILATLVEEIDLY